MRTQIARNYGARYGLSIIISTQRNSNQLKMKSRIAELPTPARFLCLSSRTQIDLNGTQIPPKYSAR